MIFRWNKTEVIKRGQDVLEDAVKTIGSTTNSLQWERADFHHQDIMQAA